MTKHTHTVKGYIYQLASTPEEAQSAHPYFAFFTFKPSGLEWVFICDYEHSIEVETNPDKTIAAAISAIDAEILKKRVELEDELANLRDRKANFLSLTYILDATQPEGDFAPDETSFG